MPPYKFKFTTPAGGGDGGGQDVTHPHVVRTEHLVPMRDGVRLAATVYRPSFGGGVPVPDPLPVVFHRTPYNKEKSARTERCLLPDGSLSAPIENPHTAERFARRGYVVVMQDCRGRYQSEGRFTKYVNEGDDGEDSLAWITTQPWCNGKVGTFGCLLVGVAHTFSATGRHSTCPFGTMPVLGLSYCAHVQLALACKAPRGLAAMFLESGGFWDAYDDGVRYGGAFTMKQVTWAFKNAKVSPEVCGNAAVKAAMEASDLRDWFTRVHEWFPGYSPLSLAPDYEAYIFHDWEAECYGPEWARIGLSAAAHLGEMADVPTLIICSWYDPYVGSMAQLFAGLRRTKRAVVRMVLGPWTHGDHALTYAGEVDFGPQATFDRNVAPTFQAARAAWFDEFLHGRPPGASPSSMASPLPGGSPLSGGSPIPGTSPPAEPRGSIMARLSQPVPASELSQAICSQQELPRILTAARPAPAPGDRGDSSDSDAPLPPDPYRGPATVGSEGGTPLSREQLRALSFFRPSLEAFEGGQPEPSGHSAGGARPTLSGSLPRQAPAHSLLADRGPSGAPVLAGAPGPRSQRGSTGGAGLLGSSPPVHLHADALAALQLARRSVPGLQGPGRKAGPPRLSGGTPFAAVMPDVDITGSSRASSDVWYAPLPPVKYFRMGGGSGQRNAAGRLDHGGTWLVSPSWPPPWATAPAVFRLLPGGVMQATAPLQAENGRRPGGFGIREDEEAGECEDTSDVSPCSSPTGGSASSPSAATPNCSDGDLPGSCCTAAAASPRPDAAPRAQAGQGCTGLGANDAVLLPHHPLYPVPTIGGNITSGEPIMSGGAFDQVERPQFFGCSPDTEGRRLCDHPCVVSWATPPLETGLEVTGTVRATLAVSSDAPDADLHVTLVDEYPPSADYPSGFAVNVASGIARARFRHGAEAHQVAWLQPGHVAHVLVELNVASNLFAKGHKIRLDVAASSFPRYDINYGVTSAELDAWRVDHGLLPQSAAPAAVRGRGSDCSRGGGGGDEGYTPLLSAPLSDGARAALVERMVAAGLPRGAAAAPRGRPYRVCTHWLHLGQEAGCHVELPLRLCDTGCDQAPEGGSHGSGSSPLIPFSPIWLQRRPTWSR